MSFLLRMSIRPRKPFRYLSISQRLASTASFDWQDPLGSKNLLTPEELDIQETAHAYCKERLLTRVIGTCLP